MSASTARRRPRLLPLIQHSGAARRTTKPTIEEDFARLVGLLDAHLESGSPFLFGHRPSQADYGIFGQLSQLHRVENTSRVVMEGLSMRVTAWCCPIPDPSGRPSGQIAAQRFASPLRR